MHQYNFDLRANPLFNLFHATGLILYTPWKYQEASGFLFSGGIEDTSGIK